MARTLSLHPSLYVHADQRSDRDLMEEMAGQGRTPVSTDDSKPHLTLLVGPSPFTMPRGWEFFLTAPYEGITYIGTVVHNAGFPVRIVDVRYDPDPVMSAYRQIMEGTDVLGIAAYEDNFPFVEAIIALVKAERPDLPVILGGSLVTSVPHVFFQETAVDVAVISEGELTILELMRLYERGTFRREIGNVRGIWYRGPGGVPIATPPRGQMPDLNSLPPMNLGLWPQSKDPRGLQPQIISSYSRGCKMDCSFCYRTTPQERVKSPEKLREELRILKRDWNIDFVFFVDLTFTAHKKQTLEYCEVIQEADIGWTCLTRNADVDGETLRAMKAAGCDIVLYGVESLGPAVLKEARKGSSENAVLKAMKNTWDAGLRYGGLTIVGLPGENEETLDHMCQWAEENQHITRVKYLSAMPGTTVYQEGLRQGIIKNEADHLRWLSIEQALERDEYLNYNNLPDSVMRRAYRRLYDSYQPGPVMNFKHYPEHFDYFDPNPRDDWRSRFSSAAAPLPPEASRYRLDAAAPAVVPASSSSSAA